ncbi:MAG TPA: hemerythrin domain-containing protein, partial [Gammaproteobacteria bacterium]|nr:hemerythrin domain-containing protein [Gammaproteobacteria bacterium]
MATWFIAAMLNGISLPAQSQIPDSVRAEHREVHAALEQAVQAGGEVGKAARAVRDVLQPHFEREEEIALPPLGLLQPLASGATDPEMASILPMTDALKAELPQMLEEHKQIRAAVNRLQQAAEAENKPEQARFAEQLALHAQAEEEVYYPAAILVG